MRPAGKKGESERKPEENYGVNMIEMLCACMKML